MKRLLIDNHPQTKVAGVNPRFEERRGRSARMVVAQVKSASINIDQTRIPGDVIVFEWRDTSSGAEKGSMAISTLKPHILLVDDEPTICETFAALLNSAGYDVSTATNGFDALLRLRRLKPGVIISDLNMPQMSGFEFLSVVRRRFPDIPVVAISGAYDRGDHVPGGVIADAFYSKGQHRPDELLRIVANLLSTTGARADDHHRHSAPVWIPTDDKDSDGVPFILLTCTQCLRSFPLSIKREDVQEIQETPCLFCAIPVRYIVDFSLAVASPRTSQGAAAGGEQRASQVL